MVSKCFVIICECYSGDNSVSVFYNLDEAIKCMEEEVKVETENLKVQGYEVRTLEKYSGIDIYVPNGDIYFNWYIEETTIQ